MKQPSPRWRRIDAARLLLAAIAMVARPASGDEPIVLKQPGTSLVIAAVNTEEATVPSTRAIAQPATIQTGSTVQRAAKTVAAKQPTAATVAPAATIGAGACGPSFVPDYRCICAPYCPKPMPCLDCCYKCCPDCYCPKPMPCPNPCYSCTCDDYCRKPYPCPLPQPLCGPTAPCRKSEPCPLYSPMPPRGPCLGP